MDADQQQHYQYRCDRLRWVGNNQSQCFGGNDSGNSSTFTLYVLCYVG
jgi:hypothetical protein